MPAPPIKKSRTGWKIAGVGCALLIVLVVALVLIGVNAITHAPLSDFPAYPGATQTGLHVNSVNGSNSEDESWTTTDSITTVEQFYSDHLKQSPWSIQNQDSDLAVWTFSKQGQNGSGTITFLAQGKTTLIQVQFNW